MTHGSEWDMRNTTRMTTSCEHVTRGRSPSVTSSTGGRPISRVHVSRAPSMERELTERLVGRAPSVERASVERRISAAPVGRAPQLIITNYLG